MSSEVETRLGMASNAYQQLVDDVYAHILRKLKRRNKETLRFATIGTAKKVLHRDNLLRFSRSIHLPELSAASQSGLSEEDLVTRMEERNLYDFLAILLFISCHIEVARTFTRELLLKESWRKDLSSLPAEREGLTELFGETLTPDRFLAHQACFCPVVIRKGEEVRIQNPERQRLPYLEEHLRAKGSFGAVYKVKIAKRHFLDPQDGCANDKPKEVARKDYITSSEFAGQEEHGIMRKILSADRRCKNVVENYGSLAIGSTIYSLFMPLALFDLRAYMLQYHANAPKDITEKTAILLCARGLARGLSFLHNEMKTAEGEDLVCYHMDLKPSNILIFREEGNNGDGQYIWKISDFGMSRVKIRHRGQAGEGEKNFNSWFLRRPAPQDPSLSATNNLRGEGTYLAPESISSTRSMKANSDVWSLGCVISVVFAYLEEGGDGVTRYGDARLSHPRADGYDRFFLRDRLFGPWKINPMVKKWHDRLIRKARQRSHAEGEAVESILDFLESAVFQSQSNRCNVKQFEETLLRTYRKYASFTDVANGSSSAVQAGLGATVSYRWPIMPLRRRVEADTHNQVKHWFLTAKEAFQGCEISPDGSIIVFWTDIKILLYTSQSLSSLERGRADPAATWSLGRLQRSDCILKSISLTKKYLIASTSGANFQYYIFDLQKGNEGADASLNHPKPSPTNPQLPEIIKLAISPGSGKLACVLRDAEGNPHSGSLFIATVTSTVEGPWRYKLNWPAADVVQLFFSTEDDIYIVIRPQLTVRSREHKIPIIHVYLPTRRLDTLIIESQGLDSSSTVGLFTSFAPSQDGSDRCAVVTREKRLHIQGLAEVDTHPATQTDIQNYRVVKLMMGWDNQRIFAIGKTQASDKLLLLEMKTPGQSTRNVSVRELAQLPGLSYRDVFVERAVFGKDENYVLIAAMMAANQCVIYKVRLPPLDVTGGSSN